MLGLIHKRVLGLAHPAFELLLPWSPYPAHIGHSKQLFDHQINVRFRRTMHLRSLFGLTMVYNLLPQYVVDCDTVSSFQRELTRIARTRCFNGAFD